MEPQISPNSLQLENSLDSSNINRLITEEQIIDTVFYTCDSGQTGTVPVSHLIECLKIITGNQHDTSQIKNDNLKILVDLLDPNGTDKKINLEAYRLGISQWIQLLRLSEFQDDDSDAAAASMYSESRSEEFLSPLRSGHCSSFSLDSPCLVQPLIPKSQELLPSLNSIMSPVSLESSNLSDDCDVVELQNRLVYVESQNKKLTEEATEFWNQLNAMEDSLSQLNQENCQLRQVLRQNQTTSERLLEETRRENSDLKNDISNIKDVEVRLTQDLIRLEQDNNKLNLHIQDLQLQLTAALNDVDGAQEERTTLQKLLSDKTEEFSSTEKTITSFQSQLVVKNVAIEDLEKELKKLTAVNESLLMQKNEIEAHLSETKQILLEQMAELKKRQRCRCSHRSLEDDDDDLEPMPLTSSISLMKHSTPYPRNPFSLHREIAFNIVNEPVLPSPLCAKELENIFCHDSSDSLSGSLESWDGMILTSSDTEAHKHQPTIDKSGKERSLQEKQIRAEKIESIKIVLEGLVHLVITREVDKYERGMEAFIEQWIGCTDARISAENRNILLSKKVRKLQELVDECEEKHQNLVEEISSLNKQASGEFLLQLKQKDEIIQEEQNKSRDLIETIGCWNRIVEEAVKSVIHGKEKRECATISYSDYEHVASLMERMSGQANVADHWNVNCQPELLAICDSSGNKGGDCYFSKEEKEVLFMPAVEILAGLFREIQRHEMIQQKPIQSGDTAADNVMDYRERSVDADIANVQTDKSVQTDLSSKCWIQKDEREWPDRKLSIHTLFRYAFFAILLILMLFGLGILSSGHQDHRGINLWKLFVDALRPNLHLRHITEPAI